MLGGRKLWAWAALGLALLGPVWASAFEIPLLWLQEPVKRDNPHDPRAEGYRAPSPAPTPVLKHPHVFRVEADFSERAKKLAVDETGGALYLADTGYINCPVYHPGTGASFGDFYAYITPPTGSMTTVEDISIAPNGDRYVCNGYNRVGRYSSAMVHLGWIGGTVGFGNGQFNGPADSAVDTVNARVLVADRGNSVVQVLSMAGAFQFQFGGTGTGNGRFSSLHAIASLPGGRIAAADRGRDDVQLFDSAGAHLLTFNGSGTAGGAFGDLRDMAAGPNGDLFVLTPDRVVVFDAWGNSRYEQSGNYPYPLGFAPAQAITVGSSGRLYISFELYGNVNVYGPAGP